MKKTIIATLLCLFAALLVGCGSQTDNQNQDDAVDYSMVIQSLTGIWWTDDGILSVSIYDDGTWAHSFGDISVHGDVQVSGDDGGFALELIVTHVGGPGAAGTADGSDYIWRYGDLWGRGTYFPLSGEPQLERHDGAILLRENTTQSYARLTQWNHHPSYSFLLTGIEEQGGQGGNYVLLRGVIVRDTLTPQEVAAARGEGTIEINGETFVHNAIDTPGSMANDRLYNARTGAEIFLVPAFFGEFEGDDMRYRMHEPDGQGIVHKSTGMYREVEVDRATPVEIWRPVVELMEWGYLEMFAPLETTAHVFFNYNEYDLPDTFPFGGSFFLIFENGRCVHMRWNR